MNKLMFLISLLKYSITIPQGGIHLLQSKYQVWQDSRKKHLLYSYGGKKSNIEPSILSQKDNDNLLLGIVQKT